MGDAAPPATIFRQTTETADDNLLKEKKKPLKLTKALSQTLIIYMEAESSTCFFDDGHPLSPRRLLWIPATQYTIHLRSCFIWSFSQNSFKSWRINRTGGPARPHIDYVFEIVCHPSGAHHCALLGYVRLISSKALSEVQAASREPKYIWSYCSHGPRFW